MNKYEGIFIIKPDLSEEDSKALLGSIADEVKKNKGTVETESVWGKKKMAYTVKKYAEGLYYQVVFELDPSALKEMGQKFRLNDNILRFMIIKKDK